MSKKAVEQKALVEASCGRYDGKSVAFVGDCGHQENLLRAAVVGAGGRIVHAEEDAIPDYIVVGEGQSGKPQKLLSELKSKNPQIVELNVESLLKSFVPATELMEKLIRSGVLQAQLETLQSHTLWDVMEFALRFTQTTIDFSNCNLSGLDLRKSIFDRFRLEGVNFSKSNLAGSKFDTISSVNFNDADLTDVAFETASRCTFVGANLTRASFTGRSYLKCDFTDADLTSVSTRGFKAPESVFVNANFKYAEFTRADFSGADLTGASIYHGLFQDANFKGAKLSDTKCVRANFRGASFIEADLTRADVRGAMFSGTNLTRAKLKDADFTNAHIIGVVLADVDPKAAKNFVLKTSPPPGPKLSELASVALQSVQFTTTVELEHDDGAIVILSAGHEIRNKQSYKTAWARLYRGPYVQVSYHIGVSFEAGVQNLIDDWKPANMRLDTVCVEIKKCPVKIGEARDLAIAAWAEVMGIPSDEFQNKLAADKLLGEQFVAELLGELRGGADKISKWNARTELERDKVGDLKKTDFIGCVMTNVNLSGRSLTESQFFGAELKGANLQKCALEKASFENAHLKGADLTEANCQKADFAGADLRNAIFRTTNLRGANLVDAIMDGATFSYSTFDQHTKFSPDVVPPEEMDWKGPGEHPAYRAVAAKSAGAQTPFTKFYASLSDNVIHSKLENAVKMLQAERFQLFSEVSSSALCGVIKSQTSSELLYSCLLLAK